MDYCTECGASIKKDNDFCPNCGTRIEVPPSQGQNNSESPSKTDKKRFPWLWVFLPASLLISICVCGSLILGVGGLFFYTGMPLYGTGSGDIAESVSGSEIIGSEGGEYSISGVKIIVPEGTLSKDVEFYVREVSSFPQLPQENSAQAAGKAFEINTSGSIEDSMPVEVVLPLDGSLQDSPDHYTVYRWDGSQWFDMGGIIVGDTIRTSVQSFSVMLPIKVEATYRPHRFVCSNTRKFSRIFLYRFTPAQGWDGQTIFPGIQPLQWISSCTITSDGIRTLPTGSYTWCVDYWHPNDGWQCYIREDHEGVVPNDPEDPKLATWTGIFDAVPDWPGRCDEDWRLCWGSNDISMPPGIGPWLPGQATALAGSTVAPPTATTAASPTGSIQLKWAYVKDGDCTGYDKGAQTVGDTPVDARAKPGYTAICWDGKVYNNNNSPGKAFCTYKQITWEKCTGGTNKGVMYTPVNK